jgi:GNAT superfamily N-acetyltransferase
MSKTNPSPIIVRRATAEDSPLVLDFIQQLARYEKLEHECIATAEQVRETLFGAKPRAESLLAFQNDQPAGFAVYFFSYSTFLAKYGLYLEDLFVKPELRGCGVGKRLFLELLRIAKENDCGRFEWSVLDWNQPAIDFYESLGAQAQGEWIRYRLEEEQIARLVESSSQDELARRGSHG